MYILKYVYSRSSRALPLVYYSSFVHNSSLHMQEAPETANSRFRRFRFSLSAKEKFLWIPGAPYSEEKKKKNKKNKTRNSCPLMNVANRIINLPVYAYEADCQKETSHSHLLLSLIKCKSIESGTSYHPSARVDIKIHLSARF